MKPYLFGKLLLFGVFMSSILFANVLNITPPVSQVTTEGGGYVEYSMVMSTEPTEDVYVGCQLSDTSEASCNSYVIFTSADWNVSRNYRVTGKNDYEIDANQTYEVTFSYYTKNDSPYSGTEKFTLINTDDDTQKVVVDSPVDLYTFESGSTATFNVVLQSSPASDVNISISSSNTDEGVIDKSLLTFTPANWNKKQVVTVTGVEDNGTIDGAQSYTIILDSLVSNDINFSGYDPIDVSINNYDIHSQTINIKAYGSSQTFESNESLEAVYGFTLNYKPDVNVTVYQQTIQFADIVDHTEVLVSDTNLTFTPANWNIEQNLTVTGVDDNDADGDISQTISYNFDGALGSIAALSVTNIDDESSLFITNIIDSQSGESDNNASFSFVLDKLPTDTVTISFSSSDTSEANLSVSSLEYNTTNWDIPQVVSVYGVDDSLSDLTQTYSIIFASASSTDANYNGKVPENLSFTNEDNETASVGIVATDMVTSESGETASFLVSLDIEPESYTRVSVISSDTTEGIISTPSLGYLSFTRDNWDTPQEVVVTGLSDELYDGTKNFSVNLSFASRLDSGYSTLTKVVALTNVDKTLPTLSSVVAQTPLEDFENQPTIVLNSGDTNVNLFTYTASSSNSNIVDVNVSGNILTMIAIKDAVGNAVVTVNATINGNTVSQNFDVNITAVNDRPNIDTVLNDIDILEDAISFKVDMNVSDVDGNDLNITVESNNTDILSVTPSWNNLLNQGSYDGVTLDFNLTTVENANGLVQIRVVSSDGELNISRVFDVNVSAVNDYPVIETTAIVLATQDDLYTYSLAASDIDNDDVTWSITSGTSLPLWLSLDDTKVTTFAGSGTVGTTNGDASSASFYYPNALASDSSGNIYVAETWGNQIRKIDANGTVTTFAGTGIAGSADGDVSSATFSSPNGVAVDSSGNVYVADTGNNKIRKIDSSGNVTTLAGDGSTGAVNGSALSSSFNYPSGVAVDSSRNVYVCDTYNSKIRKIDTSGNVTTLAGNGSEGSVDGNATTASFTAPRGLAVDSHGDVYVADTFSGKIRKVDANGDVTTVAGDGSIGSSDGDASSSSFHYPRGVVVDSRGNIYIADTGNNKVRKISSSGYVTTVAGDGTAVSTDGDANSSSFNDPYGVTVDSVGNVYVSENNGNKIRKITFPTLTGTPANSDVGMHDVNLTLSDGNGGVDTQNFTITVANVNDAPTSSNASFTIDEDTSKTFVSSDFNFTDIDEGAILNSIVVTTLQSTGVLTLSGVNVTLNQEIPSADITNLKFTPNANANGNPYSMFGFKVNDGDVNSTASYEVTLNVNAVDDVPVITSTAITTATQDSDYIYNLYATNVDTDILTWGVKEMTTLPSWLSLNSDVIVSTLAGSVDASLNSPEGVAVDSSGNIYVADTNNNKIRKITADGNVSTLAGSDSNGSADGIGSDASFYYPHGIAVDDNGNVYVADTNNNKIRKITADGNVSTLAGSGSYGSTDGVGIDASFNKPYGIAVDTSGNVYVADTDNSLIRKITAEGNVSTFAGDGRNGFLDAVGIIARFYNPHGVTVDGNGNIYVADSGNNKIRKITADGNVSTFVGSGSDGSVDGVGTDASFSFAQGITVDGSGNIYVADTDNNKIRKITVDGNVSTLAGSGSYSSTDGIGISASFYRPRAIAVDKNGNIYVADTSSHKIRKILLGTRLVGKPTNEDVGTYDINLTLSDGNGDLEQNFQIMVANVNDAPTSSDVNLTINEDTSKIFALNDFNFTDADSIHGDALNSIFITSLVSKGVLTLSDVNVALNQEINSSAISNLMFTPEANANGTPYATFGFYVNDGESNSSMAYIATINVTPVDDKPTLESIANAMSLEDASDLNITLVSNDIEGSPITYIVTSSNTNIATVTVVNGKLVVTQIADAYGLVNIEVNATASGLSALQDFNLTISNVNDAPSIDTVFNDFSILEDALSINLDINISDVDGDDLNLTVESNNTALLAVTQNYTNFLTQGSYDGVTLDFNLTTQENANGIAEITIRLNDATTTSSKTFEVEVSAVNDAVTMSSTISDIITYKNFDDMNISLGVEDIDGDALDYDIVYDNSLVNITAANSRLIIKSIEGVSGNTDVNLRVSDAETNATQNFAINILSLEDGDGVEESGEVEVVTVDGNETLKITVLEDGLEVYRVINSDSTVSHKVVLGESETRAVSNLINSIVELIPNGIRTKYEEQINAFVEVIATVVGQAIHRLTVDGEVTQATFESSGALTVIDKDSDGNVTVRSTVSSSDRNITILAKADGSSEQNITKAGNTIIIVSKLKGTQTIVRVNGDVETVAGKYDDLQGYYVKVMFIVKADGSNEARLIRVNKADSSDVSDVSKSILFPQGTEIEIYQEGGMLYMKATMSLSTPIVVE